MRTASLAMSSLPVPESVIRPVSSTYARSATESAYVLETGRITLSGTGKELMASDAVRKAYLGG